MSEVDGAQLQECGVPRYTILRLFAGLRIASNSLRMFRSFSRCTCVRLWVSPGRRRGSSMHGNR